MSSKIALPNSWEEGLDHRYYTVALINGAVLAGKMTPEQAHDLQSQIMELVKKTILKYTGGDSTSVRVETAERLLLSVLFCLDAHSRQARTPSSCLRFLREKGVGAAYEQGRQLIRQALAECRQRFEQMLENRWHTSLTAYNDTLDHGLPDFFTSYDLDFFTHEGMGGIDYPLAHDDLELEGVYYIRHYLNCLEIENAFCQCFKNHEVELLLHDYGDIYRIDYRDCLVNIFDLVLTNAVFCGLLGRAPGSLALDGADLRDLQARLSGHSPGVIRVLAGQVQRKLLAGLGMDRVEMLDYARRSEQPLVKRLHRALELEQLDKLAIAPVRPRQGRRVELVPGGKMDDESFRKLVDALLDCEDADAKVKIIMGAMSSIEDFIDILKADCLNSSDFQVLFASLGEMEMSFLTGWVCQEEWRDNRLPWPDMLARLAGTAEGWEGELIRYCLQNAYQPEWTASSASLLKKGSRD